MKKLSEDKIEKGLIDGNRIKERGKIENNMEKLKEKKWIFINVRIDKKGIGEGLKRIENGNGGEKEMNERKIKGGGEEEEF